MTFRFPKWYLGPSSGYGRLGILAAALALAFACSNAKEVRTNRSALTGKVTSTDVQDHSADADGARSQGDVADGREEAGATGSGAASGPGTSETFDAAVDMDGGTFADLDVGAGTFVDVVVTASEGDAHDTEAATSLSGDVTGDLTGVDQAGSGDMSIVEVSSSSSTSSPLSTTATNPETGTATNATVSANVRHLLVDTSTVASTQKPTVKLVMAIDNSYSMEIKQQRLATAFGQLADRLRGFNITVYFYTTTTAAGSQTARPTVNIVDQTEFPDHSVVLGHSDTVASLPHVQSLTVSLADPYNGTGGGPIALQAAAGDADFAIFKASFTSAATQIGVSGADDEDGLCTMAYVMGARQSINRIIDLREGDLVGYVILSDENAIPGTNCGFGFRQEHFASYRYSETVTDTQSADTKAQLLLARYQATEISAACQGGFRDGVYREDVVSSFTLTAQDCRTHPERCLTGDTPNVAAPCTQDQSDYSYANTCQRRNLGSLLSCTTKPLLGKSETLLVNLDAVDPCHQGGYTRVSIESGTSADGFRVAVPEGTPYGEGYLTVAAAEYPDNLFQSCTIKYVASIPFFQLGFRNSTTRSFDRTPMGLNAAASAISGARGYFVSAIINDPDANAAYGCTLLSHESMGAEYRAVVDLAPPGQGVVQSICSPDYWPALEPLSRFVTEVVNSSYMLDLAATESVVAVRIIRGQSTVAVTMPDKVTAVGARLTFASGVLLPGDVVDVEVAH